MSALEQLWVVVASIPSGFVASYGEVGKALENPVSGVLVGKWMAQCPEGVPWWRVVGKSGDLLVGHRDPQMALMQRRLLEAEGVQFEGELVAQSSFAELF